MTPERQPGVALVTGASRGVGKGIAVALGAAGMTVYVSGRSTQSGAARLRGQVMPGSIHETAAAIDAAGGRGIAVQCDHGDDAQVRALFQRIDEEQGQLDLLVNNAACIHENLIDPGPFWEKPLELVDILDVGLRSAYVASYYAAPLLLRAARGLIAFTSSFGAGCYMHGPAYGAQKAGIDKLAADMAVDFENTRVAALSLWLGPQLTERTAIAGQARADQYEAFLAQAETPQFNGRIIRALLDDPQLPSLSGLTLVSAELALRYAICEADGRQPPSWREQLGAPRVQHPARVI
ncbi:SDR family NAD(P)-dependent oxidoreductase [Pseudomonas panipatensis]|uniref:NAD(P)-dependent dehydrogenase, short-chain alcohol dehydrogenase family n=1 Tax=Pseudomonas panipatensis TaxID=428992 RepID=A0A1G8ENJ0_9PSED|nr:SDR family NAD(P)-dependent oxidoreductase [Pseudomonas panipatensis]SDH71456.1 NAD(P)-dependent dehydrogenase, short-chain alcohol dehydrogenase family [Pseudomonas panipatensis]SMP68533.1 NAD(P)-dependent dehydrogenase, short-chain alcohol dehydrogenase family [Pseudomonas panipatensis]